MQMSGGGFQFTPLTKLVLSCLLGVYVVQQLAQNWLGLPIMSTFAWLPFGQGFQPWQPFTAFLLNGEVTQAFFNWLFLFFILPAVEPIFSTKRLTRFAISTYLGSIVLGFVLLLSGAVQVRGAWFGIEPILAGLLVLFGLSRPNATILLMFILPIKAAWVAWGSGLLCLLNVLSGRDLGSAMWLAGWICGYLWLKGGLVKGLQQPFLKWKHKQLQEKLSRFDVIDGGRGWSSNKDDDNVH